METTALDGPLDRQHFIGGSDARVIMGDDEDALVRLWQEKRGEAAPIDLSGELLVQLGIATEQLNRAWYERNSGHRVGHRQCRKCRHRASARPHPGRPALGVDSRQAECGSSRRCT